MSPWNLTGSGRHELSGFHRQQPILSDAKNEPLPFLTDLCIFELGSLEGATLPYLLASHSKEKIGLWIMGREVSGRGRCPFPRGHDTCHPLRNLLVQQ